MIGAILHIFSECQNPPPTHTLHASVTSNNHFRVTKTWLECEVLGDPGSDVLRHESHLKSNFWFQKNHTKDPLGKRQQLYCSTLYAYRNVSPDIWFQYSVGSRTGKKVVHILGRFVVVWVKCFTERPLSHQRERHVNLHDTFQHAFEQGITVTFFEIFILALFCF